MKNLKTGTNFQILSLKHDQTFHRRWLENTLLYYDEHVIIGGNNQTIVEDNTQTWRTKEPAVFYFHSKNWFNVITIFKQPTQYYFYCNMISPFTYNHQTLQYIDYDIDVIVQNDYTFQIVDEEEYRLNKQRMDYPKQVQQHIGNQLEKLQQWIQERRDPFNDEFIQKWYHRLMNSKN